MNFKKSLQNPQKNQFEILKDLKWLKFIVSHIKL